MSYDWRGDTLFSTLKGLSLKEIQKVNNDELIFTTTDDRYFRMYHDQDCCESVYIKDIVGDLKDMLNTPILVAEVRSNSDDPSPYEYEESYTWTFYELATIKGSVTISWYGSSNGYYSESVTFAEI